MKMMKRARKLFKQMKSDESGQSMTEYILILLVIMMMATKFKSTFQTFINTSSDRLNTQMNGFSTED